jgi:Ca-activated chloride channel family protein
MKIRITDYLEISPFSYEYLYTEVFWFFLIIPVLVFWYLYKEGKAFNQLNLSSLSSFKKGKFNFIAFFRHLNFFVFLLGLCFIILSLARPHLPEEIAEYKKKNIEGIDIVMAMDVSGSMLAEDFHPNRLEAAKEVALDFIEERPTDRIGLVVYEGEAYTQAPITGDHELLKTLFSEVETGMVAQGTAIGVGLITAVNRLIESDAKSKVIILLTDGVNNSGNVDPITAAQVAKEYGICVYTIGVGKDGPAPIPMQTVFGTVTQSVEIPIDTELLTEIAQLTGGNFYRAENKNQLDRIYKEIDQLEKSKVKTLDYNVNPPEKYYGMLGLGLFLILIYKVVGNTWLKSIP